jgi:hypothetical protein
MVEENSKFIQLQYIYEILNGVWTSDRRDQIPSISFGYGYTADQQLLLRELTRDVLKNLGVLGTVELVSISKAESDQCIEVQVAKIDLPRLREEIAKVPIPKPTRYVSGPVIDPFPSPV